MTPRRRSRLVPHGPAVLLPATQDVPRPTMVKYVNQFYPAWDLSQMSQRQLVAVFRQTQAKWDQQCLQDTVNGVPQQLELFGN